MCSKAWCFLFLLKQSGLKKSHFVLFALLLLLIGCTTAGINEQSVAIPDHAWRSSYSPSFTFSVSDTQSRYRVYIVLRHTDAYRYKNLWLQLGVKVPGDSLLTDRRNLILATDDKGWLGKGMDDIYEHRILLNEEPAYFRKAGSYTYTLSHLMREDPLEHVMNAGIRIEKVTE
jgi:gliding motility-associated lipoprotein GldH